MNIPTTHMADVERDRLKRLKELKKEGADWEEGFKPGSFGCHELLDRTYVAAEMVQQFVLAHPACVRNPEWYALADQAARALCELYQRVGQDYPPETDEGEAKP